MCQYVKSINSCDISFLQKLIDKNKKEKYDKNEKNVEKYINKYK